MIGLIGGGISLLTSAGGGGGILNNTIGGISSLVGGIGGGNSRDKKRENREKYRTALRSLGVPSSYIDNWHSDDWKAGMDFEKIISQAGQDLGVKYIKEKLYAGIPIKTDMTKRLVSELPGWLDKQKKKEEPKTIVSNQGSNSASKMETTGNEKIITGLTAGAVLIALFKLLK